MSLQQLQAQRATFISAWQQGKITLAQRDAALTANQQQINALQASQPTVSPTPTTPIAPQQTPQNIPTNMGPVPVATFEAGAKDPTMQNVVIPAFEVAGIAALSAIPGAAPVVLGGAAIGVGAKVGIDSAVKSYESGQVQVVLPKTVREVTDTALEGAALSAIGGGAVSAVGKVAPVIVEQVAGRVAVNVGVNAAISGGASAVASGGNLEATAKGAAFGTALGLGGEALGVVGGKVASIPKVSSTIQNIKDVTVGTKFTEIVGVKEVNIQSTKGLETSITRITQPEVKTVTLRGNDAKFYRENNLGTLQDPTIELAGTQRISTISKDEAGMLQEITRYKQPVESTRSAEPILSAIKGETFQAGKVKVGEAAEFLKTPSDYSAVEKVKIEAGRGRVDLDINGALRKPDVPVTKLDKVVATNRDAILPVSEVSARDFTGVQLRGKVDSSVYADAAKALPTDISQDIYKKLGGGVNQGSSYFDVKTSGKGKGKPFGPDAPSNEKISFGSIDNEVKFAKQGEGSIDSGMQGIAKQVGRTEGKTEVQLPRSIVGEVKGASAHTKFIPTLPIQSTETKQNTKGIVNDFTIPTMGVKSDYTQAVKTPVVPIEIIKTPTKIIPVEIFDVPTSSKTKENIVPIVEPVYPVKPEHPIAPVRPIDQTPIRVIPVPIQPVIPRQQPTQPIIPRQDQPTKFKPITEPKIAEITMPKMGTKTTPLLKMPTVPKRTTRFNLSVPTAGGSGGAGLFTGKTGKWYTKKHTVKTPAQMLKTFGVNVGGGTQGFKAPNMKMGKTPNFKATGFSSNQFNKMFQQPKQKRRR